MYYYSSPRWKSPSLKRWLLSLVALLSVLTNYTLGQSTANYAFSTNTTGSLALDANSNVVDMTTGTTQLVAADLDNASSAVTNIGFQFSLMGSPYSQFSASSNGVIQLGATAVGTATYVLSGGSAASPRIGALAADLRTGAAGKVHYKVVGTAPNRCLVVEFLNMSLTFVASPGTNDGTYQVRLYETTGAIEFVYGAMNRNTSTTTATAFNSGFSVNTTANTTASITTSSNTVSNGATFNVNSYPVSTPITNLHSTADGSRRVYRFVPPVPAAPTALNFTGVGVTSMTLNWTDASNELAYQVYRSTDGINYTLAGQVAANTTTYAATGLTPSTTYYWRVYSVSEGALSTPELAGTQATNAPSLAGGIKTVGASGDYANLTTAFADINAQGLTGNIELQLITGYPAAPETYPILSSTTASQNGYAVKVYPTVSGLSITSANATGTLNLNNATNITFDGRVNQAGAKDLVIANTNAGASYAVQFVNDASNNTLKYLTIQSANTSTTSGTIVFAGSTGTTGNDNNTIDHCDIKDDATTPLNAIYSAGASATVDNSGNTVSASNIYNYFGAAANSNGIFVASSSSAWTITGNKFYQTATRTLTSGSQHRGINIVTTGGGGYTITNNVVGYANEAGTGVTTYTGSAGRFFGIELTGSNTASSIQGNTVSGISLTTTSGSANVFTGIGVLGGSANVGTVTPNTIGAATGTGAISITGSTSGFIVYGINANSSATATAVTIQNNVISGINATGSAAAVGATFTGINASGSSTTTTISGNTIGGVTADAIAVGTTGTTTASNTVSAISCSSATNLSITGNTISNISNNGSSTSSTLYGINSTAAGTSTTASTNTVSNLKLGAGTIYNILGGGPTTLTMNGNTITNATITGASGTIYGLHAATTQYTVNNNNVHDLAITANSGSSSSNVYGFYDLTSPTVENLQNNQFYNLSIAGATTSTSNAIAGILTNTLAASVKSIQGNTIYALSFANSSTGTAAVSGIINFLGTAAIAKNKIYNLSAAGAGSTVNGILIPSGTAINVYNNVIGDLRAPVATGTGDVIRGISVTSTTATSVNRIYYNTVYLNATSSGANFSTSGIYHVVSTTATTATLDMRNNIIINESTPTGTGITAAYRRSGTTLANFASTSNRNKLYAGTPGANRLIMYDGTTSYQTIVSYQTAVAPREVNSFTGEASFTYATPGSFFTSLTGANASYLKPVAGITTQVESGANNISTPAITDDYAGTIRQGNAGYVGTGTNPDLGAYEFAGVTPTPVVTLNSVTPPATTQCVATARAISVNVTTAAGTITTVNLAYTVNGTAQTPIVMTNTSGTTWEATIPAPTPTNATIAWVVAATNSLGITGSYVGTAYADDPTFGITAAATSSAPVSCSGSPVNLTATQTGPGTAQLGTGTATTSTDGMTPFSSNYEGAREQYLVRASELTALNVQPGNITSLTFIVTATGAGTTPQTNFTIKMAPTAATALASAYGTPSAAFTTVYTTPSLAAPVAGNKTFTFSTPFNWDGTSNILIDICHDNDITGTCTNCYSSNSTVRYTATTFNSCWGSYADNAQSCGVQAANTITTFVNRPNMIFGAVVTAPATTVNWTNGATPVGTGNPLAVSPTATTTYTANIMVSGCAVAPAPTTTVTITPLPSAPTATNSAQCGVQVPTASVTSTTGLPTPTFRWYNASTGGTMVQNSTSTTYTSTVSTTTTFYVSEFNTATGCESPRTPVTVNVSTPDPIAVSAAPTAICIGQSFVLTASNTNGTPFQSYTYSFQSATTGSGAVTSVAGNPVTITPTAAGTYVYTATGVDGGCAATSTVSVTVNALPNITTATATPTTVCSGDVITLTGASVSAGTGTATVGTQSTTDYIQGVYRFGYGTGDFRHQLVFTAAELNAAGVQAGNITALSFNVTTAAGGSANNYTIRMGNTAAATTTATFLTDPVTQVYTAATYTAVAGVNTHTFSTPFNWNGTSNILIDICFNVSVIGGSSTMSMSNPGATRNTGLQGTTGACTATGGGTTYAVRPLTTFSGQVGTSQTAGLNWSWTPGTGLNTPVATTSIINNSGSAMTQAYTVVATNPTTGCSSTVVTAPVTINPAPVAPVAHNGTQCGPGVPTANVTGSGIPGNTFAWYTVPTGGTAIAGQTGSALSGYNITATTTFYVAESNGTCTSPRVAVTATVTPAPTVSIAGTNTICVGTPTALTASSSNDPNYTYTWSGGLGTGATVNASPTANTTYTVTAVDMTGGANNGCNTTATYAITVNPVPTAVTASVNDATICNGETVNLSSTATLNSAPSTVTILSQNFDSGLGTWTTFNGSGSPAASNWAITTAPYSNTSTTAGFSNFTTAQGGKFAMSNADLGGSGSTTVSQLISPTFSTVGMTSATLTFQNLYRKWTSGDVTVALEISTDGGTNWTVLKNYLTLGDQGTVTNNGQATANESITLGAAYLNQANVKLRYNYNSVWGYFWIVDNVVLTGQAVPTAGVYSWTSVPAGFTSSAQNPTGVAPTVNTTYTVSVANSYSCSSTASVAVTVNQPTTSSLTQTACDSYTLNGTTYNTSGTYTQMLTNAAGCDSTLTLHLTINHSTTNTLNQTACSSYTYNGTTYNTSGTYTHTFTNAAGCDSTVTLNLTINQPTTSTLTQTACSSYTLNGTTYNTSGTYTQMLTNAAGCDSTLTLHLTINQPTTATITEEACTSYTFNGTTYNTSGTYTQVLTNAAGCDSTVTLNLTITAPTTSTITDEACTSYTFNGTTYTTSGTYMDTIPNAAGCDSIITLQLTITQPTTSSTTIVECGPSYTWNGTTYTTSGTYTHTLPNAAGCDSVATLHLTLAGFTAVATDNGNTSMTATPAGMTYQWYDCTAAAIIPNATAQTVFTTYNSDFSVIVTNAAGCVDTSDCITIDYVGIKELTDASINVFPNPTRSDVTVTMSTNNANIVVLDANGRTLKVMTVENGGKVDLSTYETGIYFLKITTDRGSAMERIVKN